MSPLICRTLLTLLALGGLNAAHASRVQIDTRFGSFQVDLLEEEAPGTVQNFLDYVNSGAYQQSFVHRSLSGFVMQGGGFTWDGEDVVAVEVGAPIANEFGRSNLRGTIAMAKNDGDPDSATSQWFINLADNPGLDESNGGFTVFGEVIGNGMQVVDAIVARSRIWNFAAPFNTIPLVGFSGTGAVTTEHFVFTDLSVVPESDAFSINTGVAGSYFNLETSGQGWFVDVIEGDDGQLQLFVAWFTYDTQEPPVEDAGFGSVQQRWFTALGPVAGDAATMELFSSSGGVFNDPRETAIESVGTLTMRFIDCTNAVISFDFNDGEGSSGQIEVIRLSPDISCQAIADGLQ